MAFNARPRGRSSNFGGGGNRQSFHRHEDAGPPEEILGMLSFPFSAAIGEYMHPCEGEMVCKATIDKVPYFNAPVFLENKSLIGKVDEILGPINGYCFTIKPSEGILATSFKPLQKIFIGSDKLLPLERFLPKPKSATSPIGTKRKASGTPSRGGGGARSRGGSGFRGGASRGSGVRGGRGGGNRPSPGGRGGFRGGSGGGGSFRGSGRGRY